MDKYNKKLNNLFKQSYFFNLKKNSSNKVFKLKKNKFYKSLIDNIYEEIKNDSIKNKQKYKKENKNLSFKIKKNNYNEIKKVKKKVLNVFKKIDVTINKNNSLYNPCVRENPFIFINNNFIYLTLGYSNKKLYDLWKYDLINGKWCLIFNNIDKLERLKNLDVILYNNELIYIGSKNYYEIKLLKLKKYNCILKLNLDNYAITEYKIQKFELLYNTINNIIEKSLFIKIGGSYLNNKINTNLSILCLSTYNKFKYKINGELFKKGIFNSKIISYFLKEITTLKEFYDNLSYLTKEEGFYLFGGHDSNICYYKSIYHLKIINNEINSYILDLKGKHPQPRIKHNIVLLKSVKSLVIYGGEYQSGEQSNNWVFINLINKSITYSSSNEIFIRNSFGSVKNENKIFIFGGIRQNMFHNNKLWTLNIIFKNNIN